MSGILEDIVTRLTRIEQILSTKTKPAETPKTTPTNGEALDEEETPKRRGPGRPRTTEVTQDEIKIKLKSVLEKKGRSTALAILEEFDAEKIGEIDKDQYAAFAKACDKALATPTPENDDLDLD